ncbi:MAG: ATP-grasp domain-containing protein [Clostridia bacterium]|nr:ATP-grasp domain-containing protein [Clostridia bacterium]
MKGLLIYERHESIRNHRFIEYWLDTARVKNVDLKLVLIEEMAFGLRDNKPFLVVNGENVTADFAVVRAKKPLLSHHLEKMGIAVFNPAHVSEILNDKRKTHALFQDDFPMMDTAFVEGESPSPFPYPVVVKSSGGCGGREVRLCDNEESYRQALRDFAYSAVVQPLCDTPGRDVRVYMLGKKILQCMLRYSDTEDFRANFGLHHCARPIDIPDDIRRMALEAADRFDFGLVGVDFIFDHGRALFNEAEDVVGTRMLYQYTDMDIVPMYMDYILARL